MPRDVLVLNTYKFVSNARQDLLSRWNFFFAVCVNHNHLFRISINMVVEDKK